MEHASNIAFTTVIFLLLSLPGYAAIATYHSGEFTRQLLPRSWTDDVVKAILWSLPFHFFCLALLAALQHFQWIHHTLNLEDSIRVLMGQYTSNTEDEKHTLTKIITLIYENKFLLVAYYVSVLGTAFAVGLGMRRAIWDYEMDVKCPALFRFNSEWLYELMGRGKLYVPHECLCQRMLLHASTKSVPHEKTLVILDALTDLPTTVDGKSQLYTGIVAGFTVNDNGGLSEILLTKAKRGKFQSDYPGSTRYKYSLEDIPGTRFVLKYSTVKNLNLTYLPAPRE